MNSWLVRNRKAIVGFSVWLKQPFVSTKDRSWVQLGHFVMYQLIQVPLTVAQVAIEIPIHLRHSAMDSFQMLARRAENQSFLESYAEHLRMYRWSIATTLGLVLVVVIQLTFFASGLLEVGRPTQVSAYSASVTLNPTWDRTGYQDDVYDGATCPITSYNCESATGTTLSVGSTETGDPANCDIGATGERFFYRSGMKFDLSSIPNAATITDVDLTVNVSTATADTIEFFRVSTDTPDTVSCTSAGSSLYEKLAESSNYTTAINWNTTGSKTHDLGATADSDVQSRITGSDLVAIGLRIANPSTLGTIDSVDSVNDPQLIVSYTLPPQAPSNTNHSTNTTSTITWIWTDNATADTSNVIHNASHTVMCTTGAVSGTGSTGSCQETGLSANTQYTRHPNVIDADGNTDGPSASAYSSIETPASLNYSGVTTSSITVAVGNTLSNLNSGSSGVQFGQTLYAESDSGWLQTNSWTIGSLDPNTVYNFIVSARNGDGDQTGFFGDANTYTLSPPPNLSANHPTSTWFNTTDLTFTNLGAWGTGGVHGFGAVFDDQPTHVYTGGETAWGPASECSAECDILADTYIVNNHDSLTDGVWYFHARSFNHEMVPNDATTADYGPYYFDGTAPTASATVNDGTGADATFQSSTTTISANWTAATDGTSGIQKYQYAIGTTAGGTQVLAYTNNGTATTVTNTGLTLSNGTTYYVSVRAVDNANNTGSSTASNGVTVNASLPVVTDNQTGDTTPRKTSGTTYDVDFSKASSGPNLDYAQYTVYSGAGKTGTVLKDWTDIFTADTATYTTNWSVDFSALQEGTNYVSVRVFALDALPTEVDDVFTIIKDTVAPAVSGVNAAAITTSADITWTTSEAADSQVIYGLTASYVTSTAIDMTLVTSHGVALAGLSSGTTYHFAVISTDHAGNTTQSSDQTFTTPSEATTPTTSVSTPTLKTPILSGGQSPTLTMTGLAKGGQTLVIRLDGKIVRIIPLSGNSSTTVSFAAKISLSSLKPGHHRLTVVAIDRLGRVSHRKTILFTIGSTSAGKTVHLNVASSYTVKSGDSLWAIAAQFHGTGMTYGDLVTANAQAFPSVVLHPNLIQPGWILTIPAVR